MFTFVTESLVCYCLFVEHRNNKTTHFLTGMILVLFVGLLILMIQLVWPNLIVVKLHVERIDPVGDIRGSSIPPADDQCIVMETKHEGEGGGGVGQSCTKTVNSVVYLRNSHGRTSRQMSGCGGLSVCQHRCVRQAHTHQLKLPLQLQQDCCPVNCCEIPPPTHSWSDIWLWLHAVSVTVWALTYSAQRVFSSHSSCLFRVDVFVNLFQEHR